MLIHRTVLDNALLRIGLAFIRGQDAKLSRFGVRCRKTRAEEHVTSVICRTATAAWIVAGVTAAASPASAQQSETVDQALCRMIEKAAADYQMPVPYFTRLIWQESNFRTGAISGAGAKGVAQFMPGTAAARGLADPFDPEQAIPKAAELLRDLARQFGNLGLAAAAYNGGPTRTANWLEGRAVLAAETQRYVIAITGRSAEDWAAQARGTTQVEPAAPARAQPPQDASVQHKADDAPKGEPAATCIELVAIFRKGGDRRMFEPSGGPIAESPLAPWGVQLAGDFSKDRALASYARTRQRFAAILNDAVPMVIGTRMLSRGSGAFYRVRIPAATREAAIDICNRLHKAGGACVVLKS
jgi:hypothetical protein